jgi:hypothetical protein
VKDRAKQYSPRLAWTFLVDAVTHRSQTVSVYWIPGYPGPTAPGPLQWPSFGLGAQRRPKPSKEDPHEEAPHEENDDKPLRTRRPPREGLLVKGGTRSVTAQQDLALAKG